MSDLSSDLGRAAFDHAADLQRQLDRLELEVAALALVGLALGVGLMILALRQAQE